MLLAFLQSKVEPVWSGSSSAYQWIKVIYGDRIWRALRLDLLEGKGASVFPFRCLYIALYSHRASPANESILLWLCRRQSASIDKYYVILSKHFIWMMNERRNRLVPGQFSLVKNKEWRKPIPTKPALVSASSDIVSIQQSPTWIATKLPFLRKPRPPFSLPIIQLMPLKADMPPRRCPNFSPLE